MNHMRVGGALGMAVLAAALTGCATAKLGAAVDLSTTGAGASSRLLAAATQVEDAFGASVRDDRFLRALQAAGVPPGKSCSLIGGGPPVPGAANAGPPSDDIAKTAAALRARAQLASALGKAYAAMNALASYDAGGRVESGVSDVFDAANGLRGQFGLAPVPAAVGTIASAGAGALAQHRQLKRLKAASARMQVALAAYREALVQGMAPTTSVMRDEIGEAYALRIALWRRGYLDANDFIAKAGEGSSLLAPPPALTRFNAADEALCSGVRASLEAERDEARGAVNDEYKAQIDAIDALLAAHQDFEKDAGVNATQLAAVLDRLTALANKIAGGK
ncbi:MAG TPA: hypothetical protein VFH92_01085 [Phenylobacterium sp.]|nr:hypothetical protein [Phenylobacterium sp.]